MKFMLAISTTMLFALAIFGVAGAQKPVPAFVDYKIAGADLLDYYEIKTGYDKAQGYYLAFGGD